MKDILFNTDCYKLSHREQYPDNTTKIQSNWVARSDKLSVTQTGHSVHMGIVNYVYELQEWCNWFFSLTIDELREYLTEYKTIVTNILGREYDVQHIRSLYHLGYLPIKIASQPELCMYPLQTPLVTVENTHPDFAWLVNYLETSLSASLWQPSTSATIAESLYRLMEEKYNETGSPKELIPYMCHDFSYRGMSGDNSAVLSGLGHLAYFEGSDTLPAIRRWKQLYSNHRGASVAATEHSVMTINGIEGEYETFEKLLELYPTGILSIVSDGYDYFNVLTNTLPKLKDKIMARDGKLVIRPDSGNPIDIICGDRRQPFFNPEGKGSLELLGETFGYTINSKGYKVLNQKIGLIYGDGMTLKSIENILENMSLQGWAAENVVFGIGSFTYQYNTRDTYGYAFKATYAEVDGEPRNIFKQPKTDPGKNSLTGRFDLPHIVFMDGLNEVELAKQTFKHLQNLGESYDIS